MTHRGRIAVFAMLALATVPLSAQQLPDPRIQQIEQKIDDLLRQAQDLRRQLDEIKGQPAAAPQTEAQPQPATPDEDLTKVDVVGAPATPSPAAATQQTTPGTESPAPALTDVQPVANQVNPGASKIFNPDTSVIGNFLGKAGHPNPYEFGSDSMRSPLQFDEAEVAFEAFIDPYAKGKFYLSASPEGLSVEEGYAQFVTLPYDLTAKAGKFKALFGKANTWHTHVRPWVDQPLVIHNFFGDEQFADSGISFSKVFPTTSVFIEGTGEVFRGQVGNVFGRNGDNRLAYNTHLKFFKDLTENANVELGTSFAQGRLPESGFGSGSNRFGGLDLTYRWKPLQQGLYRSLIARFEGLVDDRSDVDKRLAGFYSSLDYQLAQRWFAGVRVDSSGRVIPVDGMAPRTAYDHGVSATLTFWPSEFSQLRGQLRRTTYGDARRTENELLFQLQFAIGAHGAHTF